MKWWERILAWLVNELHTLGFIEKDPPQMRPALFILQPHHVREGLDLSPYGLIVCNPSIDPSTIKCAKDTILLAYVNAHMVPQYPSKFYVDFRDNFSERDYLKDIDGNRVEAYPRQHELDWTSDTAHSWLNAVGQMWSFREGYQGLYIDELWAVPPRRYTDLHGEFSTEDWHVFAKTIAQFVRQDWGGVPIIANVGKEVAPFHTDNLDGVTIESTHVKADADWRRLNDAMSHFPAHYCVAWEWNAQHARNGEIMRVSPDAQGPLSPAGEKGTTT